MAHATTHARRVLGGVVVVLCASVVVFALTEALPGDPVRARLAPTAPDELVVAERARLGLDRPAAARYADWLTGLARGDLGRSWTTDRPVVDMVGDATRASAWLILATLAVAVPLAIGLAVRSGICPGGATDRLTLALGALGSAVPAFLVGIGALMVCAVWWGWFPALSSPDPDRHPLVQPRVMALPVAVLTLGVVAYMSQLLRAQVMATMATEHLEAARLRGVSGRRLVWRHVLPGIAPIAGQMVALGAIALTIETVAVEVVFSYPGLGVLLQSAVRSQDAPTIQGIALVLSVVVVSANGLASALTRRRTPTAADDR